MDTSESYNTQEPSTLVGRSVVVRLDEDLVFAWQVSLDYATTFLCILLLQYIRKLIPYSELSFRGPKLGPHQYNLNKTANLYDANLNTVSISLGWLLG